MGSDSASPIILYDGVCGLCNRFVQFVLRHDKRLVFRFAPLQSQFAQSILHRHGVDSGVMQTVYVVNNPGENEQLLMRAGAALFVMNELGGVWRMFSALSRVLPRRLRNVVYDWVARHRYRFFGRHETCPMPSPEVRRRFLDLP